ncbi:MAG: HPP family protein [Gallionella sp.]|nr:HPP family protein [Gallionella sp.]
MSKKWLQPFLPRPTPATLGEKFRSGLAGGVAILLLGLILHLLPQLHYPLLMLGSIAASAVLLFAVPHSPLAQPWNLVAGHLVSGAAGWCCILIVPDPLLAGALAVGLSILLMYLLDALHPPGAATALTMVLSSAQFHDMGGMWALYIVAANAAFSLLLALLINNLLPGRHYPARPDKPVAPEPALPVSGGELGGVQWKLGQMEGVLLKQRDIHWALSQMDSVIDVSEDDLVEIYRLAQQHARQPVVGG